MPIKPDLTCMIKPKIIGFSIIYLDRPIPVIAFPSYKVMVNFNPSGYLNM